MSFRYPVVMPKMSMTMETGELIDYHVKAGDRVSSGDVLFEVMTDKIDMEVESPADGVVEQLVAEVGATIDIGKPVLILLTDTEVMSFDLGGTAGELPDAPVVVAEVAAEIIAAPALAPIAVDVTAPEVPQAVPAATPIVTQSVMNESVRAVPKARGLASERGIDLRTVVPSGPDKTIMYSDVLNQRPSEEQLKRQAANRALVARGLEMTQAIPQAAFSRTLQVGNTELSHLIKTWAKVLRSRPELSVSGKDGTPLSHIGVATIIESKYGSALPVYKDPDLLDDAALATLVAETSVAARNGKVPLAMLSGATTTVFDLRSQSMNSSTPLLFPGQVTALNVGQSETGLTTLSIAIDLRYCDFYDGALLLNLLATTL